jgi:hypothetical protein
MSVALKNPDIAGIRQELHDFIDNADDAALRDIYTKFKAEDNELYEWWNDEELVAELKQRADDVESGKDKGFTIEESKADLMSRLNKNGS